MITAKSAKWWAYARAVRVRRAMAARNQPWIMGRIACLGHDLLKLLAPHQPLVNTQKGRIDVLLRYRECPSLRPSTAAVAGYFARADIIPLAAQQENFTWPRSRPPSLILMDSFAELTDQVFVHRRNGRMFCANYSDLRHTPAFGDRYECRGLLPVEELQACYQRFFSAVRADWKEVPVIFVHFPKRLDEREKFRVRHDAIRAAVEAVSREQSKVYSIVADEEIVEWPEDATPETKAFPYHYNRETYRHLADQVKALGVMQ